MSVTREGSTYVKSDPRHPRAAECEAAGLRWLAEPMRSGGAHVVPVLSVEDGALTTRAIDAHWCTPDGAEQFGRALAHTHAAGAECFGQAPPGWSGLGWMGTSRLILRDPEGEHLPFGEFFATDRILPNLPAAVDNGSLARSDVAVVERLCERLRDGDFDAPQPALVKTPAARIHGDLWSGNVLWPRAQDITWAGANAGTASRRGAKSDLPATVGVLIDPAAHGGHAETDLANLGIFGQPHLERIYAGYTSESALESGWRERIALHQVHMLILHAALFGGDGYGAETMRAVRRYVN